MFIIFLILNVLPGNPIEIIMGEVVHMDVVERVTEEMGLNDPVMVRFWNYLVRAVQLDFGMSYKLHRDVGQMITSAFPVTLQLGLMSLAVTWLIGIPAGIISAIKKNSAIDNIVMGFSFIGISAPIFWIGLLLQIVVGYYLGWLPISGHGTWQHMILPSIAIGWGMSGGLARLTRSNLLEVMKSNYIRTARAKGMREVPIIVKHALKNVMLPIVTIMGMQIPSLLAGAFFTEMIFSIPGIGRLAMTAIQSRDMPLLQGTVLFAAILIILANIVTDITYQFIDPRIRVK
jgi:peptide/nickel transport system permease protein